MIISAPDCFNLVPPLTFQFHLILVGLVSNLIPSPGYIFDCQKVLALLHYTAPLIPPKDGYLLMVNWCHFLSIILHWKRPHNSYLDFQVAWLSVDGPGTFGFSIDISSTSFFIGPGLSGFPVFGWFSVDSH